MATFSSPLTRSALRRMSADAERRPVVTTVAVAEDEAEDEVLKSSGASEASSSKGVSVHKRPSNERERLIQEYTTFQNGLTPAKRRRASRKLPVSPPAASNSPSKTESLRSSAASDEVSAPAKEAENVPPASSTMPASQAEDAQTPAVSKNAASSASKKLTSARVTTPVMSAPSAVASVAVATLTNEEKRMDGAPEGELFLVNVLSREEIQPSVDVAKEALELAALLDVRAQQSGGVTDAVVESDVSWGEEYYAVDSMRRFAIHHPEQLKELIERALPLLVCPAVSSLRSAMTRNALLCIQDVILCLQEDASNSFDAFIPLLLNRASSEKAFIRDLAREVLDTAVKTCANEALLLNLLRLSVSEKNPQAVNVIGLYVNKCITRMDSTIYQTFVLEKHGSFIEEMTALLNCRVVECKVVTRKSLQHTRKVVGESNFVALVKSKLSGSAQFDVLKASEINSAAKKPAVTKQLSMRERMMQMRKQQMGKPHQSAGDFDVVVALPPPTQQQASSSTSS